MAASPDGSAENDAITALEPKQKKKDSSRPSKRALAARSGNRVSARESKSSGRASALSERFRLAAHLIGNGMTAVKASQEAGVSADEISKLRYGLDDRSKEFQKVIAKSLSDAAAAIRTTALGRLQQIMATGTDKDAVAAAREAEAMVRNMHAAEAERSKIRIERERLALEKERANDGNQQTLGIVMLPPKSDAMWLNGASPVSVPITLPLANPE